MKVQKLYSRGDTTHQETLNRDVLTSKDNFTLGEMDFNVGFSLFNNDYTKRHNMSLIQDYVRFEAQFLYYGWEERGATR